MPASNPTAQPNPLPGNGNQPDLGDAVALQQLVNSLQREQNKIQNLLSSLGFALRSFNNLNQFLELTPLMAARVTDASGGALVLFQPNGRIRLDQFHCLADRLDPQIRPAFDQVIRDLSNAKTEESRGTPSRSPSWGLDEKIQQVIGEGVIVYGTPIWGKNCERGRLFILDGDPDYAWTPTRRKLLQLVADQTAVAIANNELSSELRSKERQNRELVIASEIQLRLLPRQCPTIPGAELAAYCQPANLVGGDYYDFVATNQEQLSLNNASRVANTSKIPAKKNAPWGIVIGDVMGKGVPAGLIMTMTRGMLRAEVLNRHSPAEILRHLNSVMFADLENSHRFITLFYSEYHPQTRLLRYTNAAHNPPLWWQAQDKTLERLDTAGMLLGLSEESHYEDAQAQLAPGDAVLYYTDGITDAVNNSGDRFEEDNLCRAFQLGCEKFQHAQEILDFLFSAVQQFSDPNSASRDDKTLVVLKVTEAASK